MFIKNVLIVLLYIPLIFNQVPRNVDYSPLLKENSNELNGYIWYSGYLHNLNDNEKSVISNYSELKNYYSKFNEYTYNDNDEIVSGKLDDLLTKYDDSFFENMSLAIEYVVLTNSSQSVEYVGSTIEGNSIRNEYSIVDSSEVSLCVMDGCLIIVEVPKNVTNIL